MKASHLSMLGAATALMALASAPAVRPQAVDTSAVVSDHGDWTLKEREHWLYDRLDTARNDGSLDRHEYARVHDELTQIRDDEDRLRDHHDGQLTDNGSNDLEARLDGVASQIHWLHEESFKRPW